MEYHGAVKLSRKKIALKTNSNGQKVFGGKDENLRVQAPFDENMTRGICVGFDEKGRFVAEDDTKGEGWFPA